jgi:rhomboid protease GluP
MQNQIVDGPQETAPASYQVRVEMPQSAPYVTYTIIGVTLAVYLLQWVSTLLVGLDLPVALFAKSNELIRAGQLWRFFTPALVHSTGSLAHVAFNMYALFSFGTGLERHFGHGRFLLLYGLGAFTGNVMSFLFSDANSIGASTAVFGLIGAEGVFLYQNRKLFAGQFSSAIRNIIFIAAINLFIIGSLPGIDNWGHIGGLLGGLMFTSFAGPVWEVTGIQPMLHLDDTRSSREVVTGAAIVLLIFGALALWGMMR